MKIHGKYISAQGGYRIYIPEKLPPPVEFDLPVINALSKADSLLGRLSAEGASLVNPYILVRPFVAREAVLSSKIEGTQASISDVLLSLAGVETENDKADLQEVGNYIKALDFGIEHLETLSLSLRLLKEIHAKLMQGVRGHHATPGEFRRSQNWIGKPGSTLYNATYIPPSMDYLMQTLGDLENFLHDRSLPPLIQIALAHYQFEAIHPFLDGNGRMGRLLITLFLMERGILPKPLLYLSAFFEATRQEYYERLMAVTQRGDWKGWLLYFLHGVARQTEDSLSRASRINALLDTWRSQLVDAKAAVPTRLIMELGANPYMTAKQSSKTLGIAFTTVQRAIERLEAIGVLEEVSNAKRNRVYCAKAILTILEEPAKINS